MTPPTSRPCSEQWCTVGRERCVRWNHTILFNATPSHTYTHACTHIHTHIHTHTHTHTHLLLRILLTHRFVKAIRNMFRVCRHPFEEEPLACFRRYLYQYTQGLNHKQFASLCEVRCMLLSCTGHVTVMHWACDCHALSM